MILWELSTRYSTSDHMKISHFKPIHSSNKTEVNHNHSLNHCCYLNIISEPNITSTTQIIRMISRDFKRSKQLHPCTACLQYAPCSTASLLMYAPCSTASLRTSLWVHWTACRPPHLQPFCACVPTHLQPFCACVPAHLKPFCACVPVHLKRFVPAYARTFLSLYLRTFGHRWFQDFRSNPDSQIYRSEHAPKRSQSISRFALFRSRHTPKRS